MDAQPEFAQFEQEAGSWWYIARRDLMRDVASQALQGKQEARILDVGGGTELEFEPPSLFRVVNHHTSPAASAFQELHGRTHLVCSSIDDLAFASNSFDLVIAGDFLQSVSDDRVALRELLRVLKDGGLLCLTVPAYSFLWGEDDERRGHCRRYRANELRRKLTVSGFEVQRASYFVATGFLPLAITSMVGNVFRISTRPRDANGHRTRVSNAAMVAILNVERQVLHYINLPFGTRVVCWARKPALVTERITVPAWDRQWVTSPRLTWSGSGS